MLGLRLGSDLGLGVGLGFKFKVVEFRLTESDSGSGFRLRRLVWGAGNPWGLAKSCGGFNYPGSGCAPL